MSDDDFIYWVVMTCQFFFVCAVIVGLGYFMWSTGFLEQIMNSL